MTLALAVPWARRLHGDGPRALAVTGTIARTATNVRVSPEIGTAMYRRALDPSVFLTNWSYVDHLVLPAGASEGLHRHTGVEEVYYVINGDGEVTVAGEDTAGAG